MEFELELRYSDAIRTMIDNETTLVSNRMNWMLVLQGFLFASTAQLAPYPLLVGMLAILGIGISISIYREFKFSERAIGEILDRWNTFKATRTPEQLAAMPPAFAGGKVERSKWDRILSARRLLPFLLTFTWILIAVVLISA
jgi:hypothetical protein